MQNLEGKMAVITGGNSGIGYATARVLKEKRANVIITGRRKDAVEAAAIDLGVSAIVADQASIPDTDRLVNEIAQKFGRVDILFINAGILATSDIEHSTEEVFDRVISVNFKGAYFMLSKFIPILNAGASVVFLSSNTAHMHGATTAIYSSSKAALNSVMKIAAIELAPRGVRVNAISPGPTDTEIMKKQGMSDEQLQGITSWMIEKIPLKQLGKARNVGEMVAYLSGEESSFITGAEFIIDGGMSL